MITLVVSATDPPSSFCLPLPAFFLDYKKARKRKIFVTTSPVASGTSPLAINKPPPSQHIYTMTIKKEKKRKIAHGSNQSIDYSMTIPFPTLLIDDICIQFHFGAGAVGGLFLIFSLITTGIQYNTHATVN